jgi:hypothetical protein
MTCVAGLSVIDNGVVPTKPEEDMLCLPCIRRKLPIQTTENRKSRSSLVNRRKELIFWLMFSFFSCLTVIKKRR